MPRPHIELLDALKEFLSTASELVPKNAPEGEEVQRAVQEFQKFVGAIIREVIDDARERGFPDEKATQQVDERIRKIRAIEMTRELTSVIRRTSK